MQYILLFVALNFTTPAQLGTYPSEQACNQAIRAVYEAKTIPRGVVLPQQTIDSLQKAIDINLQYQREYTCVKQG
jgi:hypothetical protein